MTKPGPKRLAIPLSDEELYQLNNNGKTLEEIGALFGVSKSTIQGRIYRYKLSLKRGGHPPKPGLFDVALPEAFEIFGDAVIVGDVHVPNTDYDFASTIPLIAARHLKKPRKLVLAGDLFNMDAFSRYDDVILSPSWARERACASQLFKEWLQVFDEIYFIMGNHDRRLQKWTRGQFDEHDLIALVTTNTKVKSSVYGWCNVISGGVNWRISHPANYSINRLTVADALAQKFQTNIITHHEHHVAKGFDRYGHYIIVNNGTLADPDSLPYVVLDDNKGARMKQSFCMLRGGVAHLFAKDEQYTDWDMWI